MTNPLASQLRGMLDRVDLAPIDPLGLALRRIGSGPTGEASLLEEEASGDTPSGLVLPVLAVADLCTGDSASDPRMPDPLPWPPYMPGDGLLGFLRSWPLPTFSRAAGDFSDEARLTTFGGKARLVGDGAAPLRLDAPLPLRSSCCAAVMKDPGPNPLGIACPGRGIP